MSALTRLLFPAPAEVRNTSTILRWWESRRLTFNVIVGGTGLVTIAVMKSIALLPPLSMHLADILARHRCLWAVREPLLLVRVRDGGGDAARVARRDTARRARAIPSGTRVLGRPNAVPDRPHGDQLGVPGTPLDIPMTRRQSSPA